MAVSAVSNSLADNRVDLLLHGKDSAHKPSHIYVNYSCFTNFIAQFCLKCNLLFKLYSIAHI